MADEHLIVSYIKYVFSAKLQIHLAMFEEIIYNSSSFLG